MAFTLLNSELLSVTSELAIQIAQMPGSATERPLDDKRIDYLKGQVVAGQATVFNWAIAVRPDETERRINGQHSSTLLAGINGDMPSGLMVNLSRYKVEDERDEILLFRQFDPKNSLRSRGDIAGAYQMMETGSPLCSARGGENRGRRHRLVSQPQGWRAGAKRR